MVTIGADLHKRSHTLVAVDDNGRRLAERTAPATPAGHLELLAGHASVSPSAAGRWRTAATSPVASSATWSSAGEAVVRVPPKLMAGARRSGREPGKSDPIDALAVARAALREADLPVARLDGPEREVRLLVDHREDLVGRAHRAPEPPPLAPPRAHAGRGARVPWPRPSPRPRRARGPARRDRGHRRPDRPGPRRPHPRAHRVHRPPRARARRRSCDPSPRSCWRCRAAVALTAAKLIGETADIGRFRSSSAFARHNGSAPVPVWSGNSGRHRLSADRQPPAQRRSPSDRHHADAAGGQGPGLHREAARRQATPRPRRSGPYAATSATRSSAGCATMTPLERPARRPWRWPLDIGATDDRASPSRHRGAPCPPRTPTPPDVRLRRDVRGGGRCGHDRAPRHRPVLHVPAGARPRPRAGLPCRHRCGAVRRADRAAGARHAPHAVPGAARGGRHAPPRGVRSPSRQGARVQHPDVRGGRRRSRHRGDVPELEEVGLAAIRTRAERRPRSSPRSTRASGSASPSPGASPTRSPSACPRRCSSSSRWTGASGGAVRGARGRARRSAGAPSSAGCRTASRRCSTRTRPGRGWCGRWLRTFGPGTREDLRWWTGWTVAAVRRRSPPNDALEVDLDGGTDRVGAARRPRADEPAPGALGRAAAGARRDDHGLGRPRLVPGPPPGRACSTPTATPARPSGSTAASWAAGATARVGRGRLAALRRCGRGERPHASVRRPRPGDVAGSRAHPDQLPDADRDRAPRLAGRPGQESGGRGARDHLPSRPGHRPGASNSSRHMRQQVTGTRSHRSRTELISCTRPG